MTATITQSSCFRRELNPSEAIRTFSPRDFHKLHNNLYHTDHFASPT